MKRTKFRRLLPVLLTLTTLIACIFGISAAATSESDHSNQIEFANLALNNDVDLIFWADISEEDAQSKNTFMTFNDGAPIPYAGMRTSGDTTYAIYRYKDILPQDLGKPVTAKLYINSTLYYITTISPKDYCQYILSNSKSDSLKTLVSDMLVYGAETQKLLGEADENLVTNGITGLVPSETPTDMKVLFGTEEEDNLPHDAGASIGASKLVMTNGVELVFDVNLPRDAEVISDYSAVLTINGREQEVKIVPDGYYYRAYLNGIHAHEIFDIAKIDIYEGNVRISDTVTFSLVSYLDALSTKEGYEGVAKAYYNYAYSAHVYGNAHTLKMPGALIDKVAGNSMYDGYGKVVYSCSVCEKTFDTISASNIRDFEGSYTNGGMSNNVTVSIEDENGNTVVKKVPVFTITQETETLEGSAANQYLSLVRDTDVNFADGSFDYYISPSDAQLDAVLGVYDEKGQMKSDKYTFEFSVKAPEGGVGEFDIYLRNSNGSSSAQKYLKLLDITASGALTRDNSPIAGAGTVNSDSWTNVTITMERFLKDGEPYIYLEYFVNNALANSFAAPNYLLDSSFTQVYVASHTAGMEDGEGLFFDNFMLAQNCVHSFNGSVADHIDRENTGNLREIVDKINNEFDLEDFSTVVRWDATKVGGEYVNKHTYTETQWLVGMPTDAFPDPVNTPKNYQHPRILFNSSDIPAIIANMQDPENAGSYATFISYVTKEIDGKLTPTEYLTPAAFEYTNYDTGVLRAIQAKALYYAIFKNSAGYDDATLRGYEAIYAMKNYLLTFDVQWDFSDQCRMYGEMMYYAALVYDWCYDLLTEDDKQQIMLGVQNLACDGTSNSPWLGETHNGRKLEGGFPALGVESQTPLTGHGAEAQVLRDYFSFAIAIYDEDPTWYDYVGGMIYANYVDARNYFYTASYYPDGSAGYNVYRFVCDLYNAWLFKGMGVELPYNEEDMQTVIHGLVSMEINNNFMFATADGSGTSSYGQYRLNSTVGDAALISSYLFNDNAALAIAERLCAYSYTKTGYSHQLGISCADYLILTANDLVAAEDYREKIDNVEYHAGFQQQIVSRDSKDEDSVVVLMQGAQHYPGGHTHQNAGNFQIWYKGILTRDDGLYDAYGSDHHFFYHMSATAHNTLLIHNNNLNNDPLGPSNKIGYYNGAQKYELGIPGSFDVWVKDDKFSYGKLIGMETDDEVNPSYVYFANDITNAYDSETVDYVERSFMTLYTGDEETPMIMFVFDNITSDDADFQKTFLLQCATEPQVSGNTVTVDNGEGKLVLTSLLGNDAIKAYGRTSKNGVVMGTEYFYELDEEGNPKKDANGNYVLTEDYGAERFYLSGAGVNLMPGGATSIGDKSSDLSIVWGHVEVQPEIGQATNQLMNVLYVSDSGTTVSATPTLLESTYMTGATFKNYTAMFIKDSMFAADEQYFVTEGEGTMTYYIGGLSDGSWAVTVNGNEIGEFEATAEGRMITFEAECGEIVLTPKNTRPAGTSAIRYQLNGGTNPADAPAYYFHNEGVYLPMPEKSGATFDGWFLDKDFTEPIKAIPAGSTENFVLYAKWSEPIIDIDYSKGGSLGDFAELAHSPDGGGSFKIVNGTDENYLLWTDTDSNGSSIIGKDGKYSQYASNSLKVSFILTLGRNDSDPIAPFQLYLRDTKTPDGVNRYINVLKLDAGGNFYIGNTKCDQLSSKGMTTFRVVLDFENGRAYAYNENGLKVADYAMGSIGFVRPAEYDTFADWFCNLSGTGSSLITMKCAAAGSLRVGAIKILSGDVADSCKNFGPASATHRWDEGVVISEASTTDCMPGTIRYTCLDCKVTKDSPVESELPHDSVVSEYANDILVYTCNKCGFSFKVDSGCYLDGTSADNIIGAGNAKDFTTLEGTNLPVFNRGYYELTNKTGNDGEIELWVPSMGATMSGFSSIFNSSGFVAFKLNAYTDGEINFNFVDTSSDSVRWSGGWWIEDSFLTVSAPVTADGQTTTTITGWDGTVLKTATLDKNNYTDWVDVKIFISLNDKTDSITLNYYVDGSYVGSASRALTVTTDAINSIVITGNTAAVGSGIKLDDIAFGFTQNGSWALVEEQ